MKLILGDNHVQVYSTLVLTGLLGLASTLVACGGDEMTVEEAAKASSGDLVSKSPVMQENHLHLKTI